MAALFPVVLALLVLQSSPGPSGGNAAGPQQASTQRAAGLQQPAAQQPPPPPIDNSPVSDLFSIDRIRKELERQPRIGFAMPDPSLPRYRVEIEGYRHQFKLPDWRENFRISTSPVPQPLGGSDYYEMQRLNTLPQAWGSAAFSNSDLLKMYGLSGAYGLAGVLIKKGIEARQNAAVERARAEVQQELADVLAHNARVAAGQTDGDSEAKKAAEKKKRDEEKKKQEEDKKKKKKDATSSS
jgi:hypothetical protein